MTIKNIVTLKETIYEKPTKLYAVVKKCSICSKKHVHSSTEGYRSAHCDGFGSLTYELVIDRENEENLRLAKKHGIKLDGKAEGSCPK